MKKIIIVILIILITGTLFLLRAGRGEDSESIIQCLEEKGVVIYGSKYCPACTDLVEKFGGYDKVEPIYIEYDHDQHKHELKTREVPEIQIEGELYEGVQDLKSLAEKINCEI